MKTCSCLLALTIALLTAPKLHSQDRSYLDDRDALVEHADGFMEDLVNGNVKGAFSTLDRYSTLSKQDIDRLSSRLDRQMNGFKADYGRVLDKAFLSEKEKGGTLLERNYLLRFKEYPVRFHLLYYRSDEGWILVYIRWKNSVKELFDRK